MAIREQLLKTQLLKTSSQETLGPQAGTGNQLPFDIHETAKPYRRWALGFRTLVRLRYLAIKKRVLTDNRQALRYDVSVTEVQNSVVDKIRLMRKGGRIWSLLLRPFIVYPLVLAGLAAMAFAAYSYHLSSLERAVFKHDIPRFADTVYRLKAAQVAKPVNLDTVEQIQGEIDEYRQEVLDYFKPYPTVAERLKPLLDGVASKDIPPQELILHAKELNDELFVNEIPYYVSTITEVADCAHLPLETFLPRLFGGVEKSDELCWIYALLSFHVDEFRYYADGETNHLTYFTRRLDELGIDEIVLGRVHLGDNTAQILLSNIEGSSASSLTAVNDGILQSKLMPKGMPDVYGLESLARRLQSRVVEQYVEEFEGSWRWRFQRVWNDLTGKKSSLLVAAAQKLQKRTADVTAFHEVQHLVDQHNDIDEPEWFEQALETFGDRVSSNPDFRNHVLWELSAFFTHLAYGGELKGILLNEFTAITLDPMLQSQPHFYSIRILLPVLQATHEGSLTLPVPKPAATLGDVARSYKVLATNADDLDTLARDAYRLLFDRDVPDLREIALKTRSIRGPDLRQ